MKYIKTYESTIGSSKKATDVLLHMILDEISEAWKFCEDKKISMNDFKNYKYKKLDYEKVQKLIDAGADVNVHDESNNYGSILSMAVNRNDLQLVKILIQNGANINETNSCGSTPLYCSKSLEISEYLIEKGADINIPNDSGVLPLHSVVFDKKYEIATILLKAGSELSTKGNKFNRGYGLENWMKDKNYDFQKLLCELHPSYVSKNIPKKQFHEKIQKKFDYLFNVDKYNL